MGLVICVLPSLAGDSAAQQKLRTATIKISHDNSKNRVNWWQDIKEIAEKYKRQKFYLSILRDIGTEKWRAVTSGNTQI